MQSNTPKPKALYRARRYYRDRWCVWYEPCPILKLTARYIVVESADYPDSPLYKGGQFSVNRKQIEDNGKAYHSRHGEDFYLTPPSLGDLFPSKEIMATPDAVTMEAIQLGWNVEPLWGMNEWQKDHPQAPVS